MSGENQQHQRSADVPAEIDPASIIAGPGGIRRNEADIDQSAGRNVEPPFADITGNVDNVHPAAANVDQDVGVSAVNIPVENMETDNLEDTAILSPRKRSNVFRSSYPPPATPRKKRHHPLQPKDDSTSALADLKPIPLEDLTNPAGPSGYSTHTSRADMATRPRARPTRFVSPDQGCDKELSVYIDHRLKEWIALKEKLANQIWLPGGSEEELEIIFVKKLQGIGLQKRFNIMKSIHTEPQDAAEMTHCHSLLIRPVQLFKIYSGDQIDESHFEDYKNELGACVKPVKNESELFSSYVDECEDCDINRSFYLCDCKDKFMTSQWCSHIHLCAKEPEFKYLFVQDDWRYTEMRHLRAFIRGPEFVKDPLVYTKKLDETQQECVCPKDKYCPLCQACLCKYICTCEDFIIERQVCQHVHSLAMSEHSEKDKLFANFTGFGEKNDDFEPEYQNRKYNVELEHEMCYQFEDEEKYSVISINAEYLRGQRYIFSEKQSSSNVEESMCRSSMLQKCVPMLTKEKSDTSSEKLEKFKKQEMKKLKKEELEQEKLREKELKGKKWTKEELKEEKSKQKELKKEQSERIVSMEKIFAQGTELCKRKKSGKQLDSSPKTYEVEEISHKPGCYCEDPAKAKKASMCVRCKICNKHFKCTCGPSKFTICRHMHYAARHSNKIIESSSDRIKYIKEMKMAATREYEAALTRLIKRFRLTDDVSE